MRITKIEASGIRNYRSLNISFNKGINALYGRNGSGKTNIVEIIDYVTIGKSFKADSDEELINFEEEFAKVKIEYDRKQKNEIKIILYGEGKKIFKNDIELKKLSLLPGNLIDILFTPQDVFLFKDSPTIRRRLIDVTLSSIDKQYLVELSNYKRLLKDRNTVLKGELFDEKYLQIITEQMTESEFYIYSKRKWLVDKINNLITGIYRRLDEENNELFIKYNPFIQEENKEKYVFEALKRYNETKETDLKRKSTTDGIHREDIETLLNEREISLFGSQGQNRMACLALKFSLYEIVKSEIGEDPILILDDVLSELDVIHQEKLIKYLENVEQTFITCTELNEKLKNYSTYEIVDGTVIRR